jgi:hypothetical protein
MVDTKILTAPDFKNRPTAICSWKDFKNRPAARRKQEDFKNRPKGGRWNKEAFIGKGGICVIVQNREHRPAMLRMMPISACRGRLILN